MFTGMKDREELDQRRNRTKMHEQEKKREICTSLAHTCVRALIRLSPLNQTSQDTRITREMGFFMLLSITYEASQPTTLMRSQSLMCMAPAGPYALPWAICVWCSGKVSHTRIGGCLTRMTQPKYEKAKNLSIYSKNTNFQGLDDFWVQRPRFETRKLIFSRVDQDSHEHYMIGDLFHLYIYNVYTLFNIFLYCYE